MHIQYLGMSCPVMSADKLPAPLRATIPCELELMLHILVKLDRLWSAVGAAA